MSDCGRTHEILDGSTPVDTGHVRGCSDCSEALITHRFFRALASADDLSPSLPDPRVLMLKADFVRRRNERSAEGERARWTGVGVWAAIAALWLTVLTWKLGAIQGLLERFDLVPSIPGGAAATAVFVAVAGGLVAFTVFAVAVHSVLAEM